MYLKSSYPPFLASEFPDGSESALFRILPVPLERSLSTGRGTRKAPSRILKASEQLEVFDGKSIPAEKGIRTLPPVSCRGSMELILNRIAEETEWIFSEGRIPVLLGGEHSISNGAFLAILRQIQKGAVPVGIVQIDARADLRDLYEGSPYSPACVMKRAVDLGFPIYQMGVRSLSPGEMDVRREKNIPYRDAPDLCSGTGVRDITLSPDFPDFVYLTIDAGGLDPSVIPGTGSPEAGGLGWYQILSLIDSIAARHRIIGFDLVELVPERGTDLSEHTAARLVYQIMGIIIRHMG